MVDQTDERKEDSLAGRGLDNGGFSNAGGIQVDVGPFLHGLGLYIEIQQLDHVADEVW